MGLFSSPKHVHMVGIKGVGMTALAQVLAARGHTVTGSDSPEEFFTDAVLRRIGIPVTTTFAAKNVPPKTDVLVHSAAYTDANPEMREAKGRDLRVMVYPEALGELSKDTYAIGVAGMHGKTTTTAMLGITLVENGFDPTVVVGSRVPQFDNMNARIGASHILVAETCEYRRHFLHYSPNAIVVTNIEPEHLDYFRDATDIEDAFLEYIDRLRPYRTRARERIGEDGSLVEPVAIDPLLVLCIDDAGVRGLLPRIREHAPSARIVTYGTSEDADCRISDVRYEDHAQHFSLTLDGRDLGKFRLSVPGLMNVRNAAAAAAMTFSIPSSVTGQVPTVNATRQALASFTGTTRRFEIKGHAGGVTVIDDYGHHPTEISVTLDAARSAYPNARIWVDFMPHTYSRTKKLLPEFGTAFRHADRVILHHIYASAREEPDPTITGEMLAAEVRKHHANVEYIPEIEQAVHYLLRELRPGDVLITFGAGDNWRVGTQVLEHLHHAAEHPHPRY